MNPKSDSPTERDGNPVHVSPAVANDPEASKPVVSEHDRKEADRVEETTTPRTPVIYETVRRAGEEEMHRPAMSLWWSGIAAGLSISFSVLIQGVLHARLPDASWRDLVVGLGYPFGFLIVVIGRQQLFTENTITVVLPVMARTTAPRVWQAARLWGIVLGANLTGTLVAALFVSYTPAVSDELLRAMREISAHALAHPPLEMLVRAIGAGYLMAAMVWLMPGAAGSQFPIVMVVTYVIGVGGFAHIVAGSIEAFLLLFAGQLGIDDLLLRFALPTLVGNVIGGTALFALISYAQVMREIEPDQGRR